MKKVLISFMTVMMMTTLVACGNKDDQKEVSNNKELIVQTNSGYKPYEMAKEDGELYGFDIDVMNEIGKIAGYTIKWQDVSFDSIIPSVKSGKADAGIAGISYDEKRAKQVDFTEMYYGGEDVHNFIVSNKNNKIKSLKDLKGKTVGTQMGTVQESILLSLKDKYGFKIDARTDYSSLVLELNKNNGTIDALLLEKVVAEENSENIKDVEMFEISEGAELLGNGIVIQKGSPLKDEFNKALKEMQENGKMDELIKKWFE